MKAGKVSAFKSWTSDAEATAAAPMSPKAMFLKLRILVAETMEFPRTVWALASAGTRNNKSQCSKEWPALGWSKAAT
jgi:hypothetical protein